MATWPFSRRRRSATGESPRQAEADAGEREDEERRGSSESRGAAPARRRVVDDRLGHVAVVRVATRARPGRDDRDGVVLAQRVLVVGLAPDGHRPPSAGSVAWPISKRTTVMLSSPPLLVRGVDERLRAGVEVAAVPLDELLRSPRRRPCRSARRSRSCRRRRPASSTEKTSTSTSGSVPSARVITERCGWFSASSGDSLPRGRALRRASGPRSAARGAVAEQVGP